MRLRPLSLLAAFLLLLVLAYTAWWVAAAAQLRRAMADLIAVQQDQGNQVEPAAPGVGGYPLRLAVRLERGHWRRMDGALIEAADLEAWARPWNPLTVRLEAEGPVRLMLPATEDRPALDLGATAATGEMQLDQAGGVRQARLRLDQPQLAATDLTGPLTAARMELGWSRPVLDAPGPLPVTGIVNLHLADITLPGRVLPPLEPQIHELALEAQLRGMLPPSPDIAALRGWSEAGGTVELTAFRLLWGRLDLRGNATLALDSALQPIAAGSAELSGSESLIDMLVAADSLTADQGNAARAALGFLSRPTPDGRRAVQVPVTIQDQSLSIGPIRVGRVPSIRWD